MGTRILDSIQSPDALSLLSVEELEILASEIRQEIIEVTSKNGGHVASSLGAVEIILAAHSQLHSPHDRFLFDVGHQSYAHMLVTDVLMNLTHSVLIKVCRVFQNPNQILMMYIHQDMHLIHCQLPMV